MKKKNKFLSLLLLPLGVLITFFASSFPQFIEKFFSNGIYKIISQPLSSITGLFPISIGEIITIITMIWIILYVINTMIDLGNKRSLRKKILQNFIINILSFISIGYFIFITIWGANYHRLPFSEISGLEVKSVSVTELEYLCKYLINRTNELRNSIEEDSNGIMKISGAYEDLFDRALVGFMKISRIFPELGGKYGKPKKVILSKVMSYAGITGIYFPFTGEANINTEIPHSLLPCTICHEMAHQRGFAREEEANYIAYRVCTIHSDTDFQYSGLLLGLIHSMNALSKYDFEKYAELKERYSEGVKRDLATVKKFWKDYEGPVERISTGINDAYLKSNMQEYGVKSYGKMVDLLLAEYLEKNP